jgi:hypothetical protein
MLLTATSASFAATIPVAGEPLWVSANNSAGVSFDYTGTVSSSDTISFVVWGEAFLQSDPKAFGTNAAGIIKLDGGNPNEAGGSFKLNPGTDNALGSLLLEVDGMDKQVFLSDATDGLGSAGAPKKLEFSGTLGSIFGSFNPITDPTFTFVVADEPGQYSDNSGGYKILSPVPVPAAAWQSLAGLLAVGLFAARKSVAHFFSGGSR